MFKTLEDKKIISTETFSNIFNGGCISCNLFYYGIQDNYHEVYELYAKDYRKDNDSPQQRSNHTYSSRSTRNNL